MAYFFAFKFQVQHLNKFCKKVEEFNRKNDKFNKKLIHSGKNCPLKYCRYLITDNYKYPLFLFPLDATRKVSLTFLAVLISLIPVTVGWLLMYQKIFLALNKRYPLLVLLWHYISGPISTCIFCYMPIFASGDLITTYLIDYMSNYFTIWSSLFKQKKKEVANQNQDASEINLLTQSSENRY